MLGNWFFVGIFSWSAIAKDLLIFEKLRYSGFMSTCNWWKLWSWGRRNSLYWPLCISREVLCHIWRHWDSNWRWCKIGTSESSWWLGDSKLTRRQFLKSLEPSDSIGVILHVFLNTTSGLEFAQMIQNLCKNISQYSEKIREQKIRHSQCNHYKKSNGIVLRMHRCPRIHMMGRQQIHRVQGKKYNPVSKRYKNANTIAKSEMKIPRKRN